MDDKIVETRNNVHIVNIVESFISFRRIEAWFIVCILVSTVAT